MAKRHLSGLILACLTSAMLLTGLSARADTLQVGILDSRMMGFRDQSNQLTGFEAELAQQICDRMQRQCDLTLQPFSSNLDGVKSGQLDMALSSILVTEARKQYLIFSERYMRSVSSYIGNPDRQPKYRPARVGVVSGSVQQFYLQQNHSATIETQTYPNIDEVYAALKAKEIDQVLLPAIIQLGFLYNDTSGLFDLIGGPIDNPKLAGDVAVAISPKKPTLKADVDRAIRSLLTDGSYNKLNNKYFPFNIY